MLLCRQYTYSLRIVQAGRLSSLLQQHLEILLVSMLQQLHDYTTCGCCGPNGELLLQASRLCDQH